MFRIAHTLSLASLCAFHPGPLQAADPANLAEAAAVRASGAYEERTAALAVDGVVSDESRWVAPPSPDGHWLEIALAKAVTVRQAHVYSGYQHEQGSTLRVFYLEQPDGHGGWTPIPGAAVRGNDSFAMALTFAEPVTADRFRLRIEDAGIARLREITLWERATDLHTGVLRNEGEGEFGAFAASREWTPPADPAVLDSLSRWQDRKLGLLISWGIYSQWGITESWSQITTRHAWNPRPEKFKHLSDAEYQREYAGWITTFNPQRFDAGRWARAAADAGVKYVLVTSKHLDGFAMWDTAATDFRVTSPKCPFHADPRADTVRETVKAFRAENLSTGIYFSKPDWNHSDYWLPELGPGSDQGPNYHPPTRPERWERYKAFTWRQIEELMTGYGPQDVLWLDGGSVRPPHAGIDMDGLAAMARKHQPGLIVVDRTVRGRNENYITPEGVIPPRYLPYPWETCMTMGTKWVWVPNDRFKSAGTLIRNLCRIVARNGNYLLGIGPDGQGEFDPVVYERLAAIGAWLKLNGEAIYSTRPVAPYEQTDAVFTQKRDGTVYVIVTAKDDSTGLPERVTLPVELRAGVVEADLLGHGALPVVQRGVVEFPPDVRARPPCEHAWVLRLQRGPPAPTANP